MNYLSLEAILISDLFPAISKNDVADTRTSEVGTTLALLNISICVPLHPICMSLSIISHSVIYTGPI